MSEEKNINLWKPGMLDKKWGSGERGKRRGQGVVRATIGLSHGSQSFKKEGVVRLEKCFERVQKNVEKNLSTQNVIGEFSKPKSILH